MKDSEAEMSQSQSQSQDHAAPKGFGWNPPTKNPFADLPPLKQHEYLARASLHVYNTMQTLEDAYNRATTDDSRNELKNHGKNVANLMLHATSVWTTNQFTICGLIVHTLTALATQKFGKVHISTLVATTSSLQETLLAQCSDKPLAGTDGPITERFVRRQGMFDSAIMLLNRISEEELKVLRRAVTVQRVLFLLGDIAPCGSDAFDSGLVYCPVQKERQGEDWRKLFESACDTMPLSLATATFDTVENLTTDVVKGFDQDRKDRLVDQNYQRSLNRMMQEVYNPFTAERSPFWVC